MRSGLLRIDADRLWRTLEASAGIGTFREVGLQRLALGDADREVRDLFKGWAEDAGLRVEIDDLGNMLCRREGREPELAPLAFGSHLDTQICGGRFDGILGLLAGLEAVRVLNDQGIVTRRPLVLVNWTNEEGARFSPPMSGSAGYTGVMTAEAVVATTDFKGLTFGQEVTRIGYRGETTARGQPFHGYLELHIEQGPVLDAEGIDVGIVTGGYPSRGMRLLIRGETAHVGPTPMADRRNAAVAAALIAVAVQEAGEGAASADGKSSVSQLSCWPNLPGILPEEARLTLDFRAPEPALVEAMAKEIEAGIEAAAARTGTVVEVVQRWGFGKTDLFAPAMVDLLRATAEEMATPYKLMRSQAGHDAYNVAQICPTAMIFTPCKRGITHNVREDVDRERTIPGCELLLNAVLKAAER